MNMLIRFLLTFVELSVLVIDILMIYWIAEAYVKKYVLEPVKNWWNSTNLSIWIYNKRNGVTVITREEYDRLVEQNNAWTIIEI